ncbi:transposase family protein, partial [Streptomyces sp. NPDC049944]
LVDRLLATLLYERLGLPQVAIARLFAVAPQTINRRIRKTHQLLDEIGHINAPAEHRLATLDDLADLATQLGITPPPEIKTAS